MLNASADIVDYNMMMFQAMESIIGATKCVDTAKDLYPSYIFEKSQGQEHNNLDYQMNLFHLWVP